MTLREQLADIAARAPGMTITTAEAGDTALVLRFADGARILVTVTNASWIKARPDAAEEARP